MKYLSFKVNRNGSRAWYLDGRYHRDNDQPAIVWPDHSKKWYVNGKPHRDNNQPAYIGADGTKLWYFNGIFLKSN